MNTNIIESIYKKNLTNQNLKPVSESFDPTKKTTVLVFCYAFNHEKYIARCIDSMLSQLVDFNVKIIIHNDNSTDSTKEIIDQYSKKYPKIITTINQPNNLYSKDTALLPIFQYLRQFHEGEFIANCEGDDYWTDVLKLKTQVDMLKNFPECHFCVHKVNVLNSATSEFIRTIPAKQFRVHSGVIKPNQFISLAMKKYPFQTSSYMFRTNDFSHYLDNLPSFAKTMPTEDESLILYFGQLGDTCYINHSFSNYMKYSEGSWSNDNNIKNVEKKILRLKLMISSIEDFNCFTYKKFEKDCASRVTKHQFGILRLSNRIEDALQDKELRKFFRHKYFRDYCDCVIRYFFKSKRKRKVNEKND